MKWSDQRFISRSKLCHWFYYFLNLHLPLLYMTQILNHFLNKMMWWHQIMLNICRLWHWDTLTMCQSKLSCDTEIRRAQVSPCHFCIWLIIYCSEKIFWHIIASLSNYDDFIPFQGFLMLWNALLSHTSECRTFLTHFCFENCGRGF